MNQIEELSKLLVEFYEKFSFWEYGVVRGETLTLSQMHTVEILSSQGALKMKELAEKMGITAGTLTVLVDRLEDAGSGPVKFSCLVYQGVSGIFESAFCNTLRSRLPLKLDFLFF